MIRKNVVTNPCTNPLLTHSSAFRSEPPVAEEIRRMPHEMALRGVPALAVQLARRKTVDGRDQLIMRVESPCENVAHLTEVAQAVLRLNHHLEEALFSFCSRTLRRR